MHFSQHLTCICALPASNPAVLPRACVTHKGQADGNFLGAELDGVAQQDQGNVILQAGSVELLVQDQTVRVVLLQWDAEVNSPHCHCQIWWP